MHQQPREAITCSNLGQTIRQRVTSSDPSICIAGIYPSCRHCPLVWRYQSLFALPSNSPPFPWWSGLTHLLLFPLWFLESTYCSFIACLCVRVCNYLLLLFDWQRMRLDRLYHVSRPRGKVGPNTWGKLWLKLERTGAKYFVGNISYKVRITAIEIDRVWTPSLLVYF